MAGGSLRRWRIRILVARAQTIAAEQKDLGVLHQAVGDGGGEQHAVIGLTGAPAYDLGEEGFADTRIADEDRAGALLQKLQIEQAQNARFQLQAALVVFELKAVDGVLGMQPREAETALNGATLPGFQFEVDERFQSFDEAAVAGRSVSDRLIQLAGHRGQAELIQFLVQWCHGTPFGNEE